MKYLLTLLLISFSLNAISQSSYNDSKIVVKFAFDVTFEVPEKNGVTQKFVLSSRKDFKVSTQTGPFKTLSILLEQAFRIADCGNCEKISEEVMIDPITYIYDDI